ncbi:hypothetical protein [Streptomyces sp. NBC_01451]|uniref:hypothetical protein n=1 Tax=Streptomyces sp. NBC_01451 TaxID=2903872 RepID=UPI002E37234E|nr:hypothetical protein [Streptomyces sp. NBC_01451]
MPMTALDAANDVLARARGLLALDAPNLADLVREDIRRTSLALGVAALDTYMHWAIRSVSFAHPLPKELRKVPVTFGKMLAMADGSVAARKNGIANRPQVQARNALNEQLLTMTFQGSGQIEKGLKLLDKKDVWRNLAAAMQPAAKPADLKARLDEISFRRNMIVHEGDLTRLERPQRIKREAIKGPAVQADLDWLQSFISALATL